MQTLKGLMMKKLLLLIFIGITIQQCQSDSNTTNTIIPRNQIRAITPNPDNCGICKCRGGDVMWFSRYSNRAHRECFSLLAELEGDFYAAANVKYPATGEYHSNFGRQNHLHEEFIQIVEEEIISPSETESIKAYIVSHGIAALAEFYRRVASGLQRQ